MTMTLLRLPLAVAAPHTGWTFHGSWATTDRDRIERVLRERIPNPTQAQADPWLFLIHNAAYYAHSPAVHAAGVGYCAPSADDLADLLWDHYFSLRLGPLAWAPPTPAASQAPAPLTASSDAPASTADSLIVGLEREWEALEHFETACDLLADGEYAAAKRELELSLSLYPATGFYDHKRVETLGDIESCLGEDEAARQHYQRALDLALAWRESWTHTELRLKLAWCLLRQASIDEAHRIVETALAICQASAVEDASKGRGLTYVLALALATLADVYFHRNDTDLAIAAARQAARVAGRLGQAYAQKVRLLMYLAWQLYRHDEATEARALAQRAQATLDRWMPLDARHVRALRATLATILGVTSRERKPASRTMLPSLEVSITQALAAARAMQDWLRQLLALHRLAPYLRAGQVTPPFTDIHVWSEELAHEKDYQILLAADLHHALAGAEDTILTAAQRLSRIDCHAFRYLGHEWLYAESLVQMRDRLSASTRAAVENHMVICAMAWRAALHERIAEDAKIQLIEGLAVLLPHLPPDTRRSVCGAMEAALLTQLRPDNSLYADAFLTGLPALARCGAGHAVYDTIMQDERQSLSLSIACLAHAANADADISEAIIETALRGLQAWLHHGSSTDVAEMLCHLAPYLHGEQARRALALATSVRSISPRVRALAAIARALPGDERTLVYERAWQAAQRSTNADVRGEALAALVVSMVHDNDS
jgi:tetratricopeptide (TPR) repeat protein